MEGPSASNGKDEVEDDDRGHWTAGPNLPVFQDEGLAPQRQRVHGQKWVPIKTFERPVAKAHLLGLCRTRPRPKKAVTVAAARRARQQPEHTAPRGIKRLQPTPPPYPPPVQRQQPLEEGPVQPKVFSEWVTALGELQQQQTALSQQHIALQQQAVAWREAAMQQVKQDAMLLQQQQPMPQQQAVEHQQQPVAMHIYEMQHAVPLQEAGSRMPLLIGLGAQPMLYQGHDAASGNAAVANWSAAAASGSAAPSAASGSAAAARGRQGPTADQWPSPTWKRQCRRLKDKTAKAQESANAIMEDLRVIVQTKADP